MRLVYMGTPSFAVPALRALASSNHEIVAVVTRTDKPAGRGRELAEPPVKLAAQELGLAVHQPKRVREPEFLETLKQLAPDMIVVAAYGQILPKAVLELPRLGCVNIHASLLPAYRGAAPINWAIIRGEREAGVTIMQMDEGMDTGAVLLEDRIPIDPQDTAGTLTGKLSRLGAELLMKALPGIEAGSLRPAPQDHAKATLAPLLKKEDGLIDWTLPAQDIANRVRGFSPWPGAFTFLEGSLVKVLQAEVLPGTGRAGEIMVHDNRLVVGTGRGLLGLNLLQPAGKKPMTAADFLRGHREIQGKRFSKA